MRNVLYIVRLFAKRWLGVLSFVGLVVLLPVLISGASYSSSALVRITEVAPVQLHGIPPLPTHQESLQEIIIRLNESKFIEKAKSRIPSIAVSDDVAIQLKRVEESSYLKITATTDKASSTTHLANEYAKLVVTSLREAQKKTNEDYLTFLKLQTSDKSLAVAKTSSTLGDLNEAIELDRETSAKRRLRIARAEKQRLSYDLGPRHPKIRALTSLIYKLKQEEKASLASGKAESLVAQAAATQSKLAVMQKEESLWYEQLAKATIFLQQQLPIASLAKAAEYPHAPNAPITWQAVLLRALGGATVSLIFLIVFRNRMSEFLNEEDVSAYLELPVVSTIPLIRSMEIERSEDYPVPLLAWNRSELSEDCISLQPQNTVVCHSGDRVIYTNGTNEFISQARTAFRDLRTNMIMNDVSTGQVILVASSEHGEGRTTVATNLASALAKAGRKTLLINAHLRKMRVRNLENWGLADYLSELVDFEQTLYKTAIQNLWAVSAGASAEEASDLLSSPRLVEFIADAKQNFEHIIIDPPASGPWTDSVLLSRVSDSTLFVVNEDTSNRLQAKKTVKTLQSSGANISGVVINKTYTQGGSRHKWSRRDRYRRSRSNTQFTAQG